MTEREEAAEKAARLRFVEAYKLFTRSTQQSPKPFTVPSYTAVHTKRKAGWCGRRISEKVPNAAPLFN